MLSARPVREADRIYSIFTSDFGLVRASAGGVRKLVSKLRGNLEPFSLCSVSMVRGKEFWRITNSVLEYNLADVFKEYPEMLRAFARVFHLLEKLLAGESAHPELVEKLEEVISFARTQNISEDLPETVEILMVSRVLHELGYLSPESVPKGIIEGKLSSDILALVRENKKPIIKVINEGLQSSGLTE